MSDRNETLISLIFKLMHNVEYSEYDGKSQIRGYDPHENTVLTDDEANLLLDLIAPADTAP